MTTLRDKRVLITGAASGIGRLMASLIAQHGAKLVLWDHNSEGLRQTELSLQAQGYPAVGYHCNLASREQIQQTAERVLHEQGVVDVLINNAGVVTGKYLLDASDAEIERTFAVNTLALFWTTRAFLPGMLKNRHGHIVTIASAAGLIGPPRLSDYAASKFAAVGLDESLRSEMRRLQLPIRTTVVCPFYIDTGLFAGVKTRFPHLLPILKADYVARRIVRAIEKDDARLVLPMFVRTVWLSRLLPVKLFDWMMDFFGITKNLDEFKGRQG